MSIWRANALSIACKRHMYRAAQINGACEKERLSHEVWCTLLCKPPRQHLHQYDVEKCQESASFPQQASMQHQQALHGLHPTRHVWLLEATLQQAQPELAAARLECCCRASQAVELAQVALSPGFQARHNRGSFSNNGRSIQQCVGVYLTRLSLAMRELVAA